MSAVRPPTLTHLFNSAGLTAVDPLPEKVTVSGVTESTDSLGPGMLFVARKGIHSDGHAFLRTAARKGASAAVVERQGLSVNGLPCIRVENTANALGKLCGAYYGNPSRRIRLIGVTGTDGKTTTSHFIESILRKAGRKVAVIGTLGSKIEDKVHPSDNSTPPPVKLQWLLSQAVMAGCEFAVLEVSSHAVVQRRLAGCRFFGGVLTNVAVDHLELHASIKNYRQAKRDFFCRELLANQNNTRPWQVLNLDNSVGKHLCANHDVDSIYYSLHKEAPIRALNIVPRTRRTDFTAVIRERPIPVQLKMSGVYNVRNALAAVGVGVACNIPSEIIKAGLEAVENVRGRFEYLDCGLPFDVVIDYAHTPQAVWSIMRQVRQMSYGRLVVVFSCPGDRWIGKRTAIGQIVGRYADLAVVTTDNPGFEDPLAVAREIIRGISAYPPREGYMIELDRARAVEMALNAAGPGDLVLLLGKGHEEFQLVQGSKIPFSEKETVLQFEKGFIRR